MFSGDRSVSSAGPNARGWRDLEPKPFDAAVQQSGYRDGDSLTDDAKAITSAAAGDRVGELELFPAEREESNDAFLGEAMSNVADISTLRPTMLTTLVNGGRW